MSNAKPTPGTVRVPLTKEQFSLIDAQDYDLISGKKWQYANGYAVHHFRIGEKTKRIAMHRLIMNAPEGLEVDHIDGNKLNNSRSNLRLCTFAENMRNRRKMNTKTSQRPFKGVRKRNNRWQAEISVDGKNIHLGSFLTSEEAAAAYDKAAKIHHKEFANVNGVDAHGVSQPVLLQQANEVLQSTGLTPRQLAAEYKAQKQLLNLAECLRGSCEQECAELTKQRDELLAALEYLTTHSSERHEGTSLIPNHNYAVWLERARKAIAGVKGGA